MKHVIIDTDPGIDDALAILLAFSSPELRVEALTTVVGNVSLRKANVNALKLLEFLRRDDVPVVRGRGARDRAAAVREAAVRHRGAAAGAGAPVAGSGPALVPLAVRHRSERGRGGGARGPRAVGRRRRGDATR